MSPWISKKRYDLAIKASTKAYKTRLQLKLGLFDPVDVYEIAKLLELEVRTIDVPSMEGMYIDKEGDGVSEIWLSSHRPVGRIAFNCAHEIGHHVFNHGTRLDQYLTGIRNDEDVKEEFLANRFASFLLMPKNGILKAFSSINTQISTIDPISLFKVSTLFGVGYEALGYQLSLGIGVIQENDTKRLLETKPAQIKELLLGMPTDSGVYVVGRFWKGRPLDIQIADYLLLEDGLEIEGDYFEFIRSMAGRGSVYRPLRTGVCVISDRLSSWTIACRISRQNFNGLTEYRFLEK